MTEEKKTPTQKELLEQKLQKLKAEQQYFINQINEFSVKANVWEGRIQEITEQIKELK